MTELLRDFWYLATPGRDVKRAATKPVTLLGEQVLVGRKQDGGVFAYGDWCPHRGMPMRHGGFDGTQLRCGYHGWAFGATDGRCTEIPSLAPGQETEPARFRLRRYEAREVQGNIWIWIGASAPDAAPPELPGFGTAAPQVSVTERFRCHTDLAVAGFIDPGHPAFVHTSRWWKSNPASKLRVKEKQFEPAGLGFRMARHHLKHGANPYRLLGRNVHIDIAMSLPGIRLEHIQGDTQRRGPGRGNAGIRDRDGRTLLRVLDPALARRAPPGRVVDGARLPAPGPGRGQPYDGEPGPACLAIRRRSGHPNPLVPTLETRTRRVPRGGPGVCQSVGGADAALAELDKGHCGN